MRERERKNKRKTKKDRLRVHPANTAAKLTGKQDRSTARVGGFNPELVRLRRRSAPVSLVRTLRVLPSRSLGPHLSLSFSLHLAERRPRSLVPSTRSLSRYQSPIDVSPSIRSSLSLLLSRSLFCLSNLHGYCSCVLFSPAIHRNSLVLSFSLARLPSSCAHRLLSSASPPPHPKPLLLFRASLPCFPHPHRPIGTPRSLFGARARADLLPFASAIITSH